MSDSNTSLTLVMIGVSGCGKSTIGRGLAPILGAVFIEGDDYHPPANVAKMRAAIELTDIDRWPWLEAVGGAIAATEDPVVVACSALRHAYRTALARAARKPLTFVLMRPDPAILESRLRARRHPFMPPSLLGSQLAALEPLRAGEDGTEIRNAASVTETLAAIEHWLDIRKKRRECRPFR